jgi:glucose-6-phosphate dehydrogenase assembly protein OpcA
MTTTIQALPVVRLLSPKEIAVDAITTELNDIWLNFAETAVRATTFTLVVYEPEPIQHLLTVIGFYDGPIDGIMGPLTRDALLNAQKAYDLPRTGLADEITFTKLKEVYLAASKQGITPTHAEQNYRAADAIAQTNPCRIIALCETVESENALQAQVAAYCPIKKQHQSRMVCCEYITLAGSSEALEKYSDAIKELLIPELPQFLWWKGTPGHDRELFLSLANSVTSVILDSATFANSAADLQQVPSLLDKKLPLVDINWQRIAPWQELTAATFDPPERRVSITEIDEVEINFERGSSAQAWLYLAWLAGRLGWIPNSYHHEGGDYNIREISFRSSTGREIKTELASMPIAEVGEVVGDLMGIKLSSTNPDANCCTILCSETAGCMQMESKGGAQICQVEQVNSLSDQNAEQLVSTYFSRSGQDWLYEETMNMLGQILALVVVS